MTRKTPVTRAELETARSRLEHAIGEPVTLFPGSASGGLQWAISPALGRSFGAIGATKRDALATLNALTLDALDTKKD